jgi:hypothetical protein
MANILLGNRKTGRHTICEIVINDIIYSELSTYLETPSNNYNQPLICTGFKIENINNYRKYNNLFFYENISHKILMVYSSKDLILFNYYNHNKI